MVAPSLCDGHVSSRSSSSTRAAFALPASGPSVSRLLRSYAALRLPHPRRLSAPVIPSFGLPPGSAQGKMRSPGAGRPFARAAATYPAGCAVPSPFVGDDAVPSEWEAPRHPEAVLSWLDCRGPFARRLRIADPVTVTVARLATDLSGSTWSRGFPPAVRLTEFA